MIELYNVTDYGRYAYNREADTKKDNQDVDFGEVMTGFDEMSDRSDDMPAQSDRAADFNPGTFIDMVTYNHGGKLLMLNPNLGATIDIVI